MVHPVPKGSHQWSFKDKLDDLRSWVVPWVAQSPLLPYTFPQWQWEDCETVCPSQLTLLFVQPLSFPIPATFQPPL